MDSEFPLFFLMSVTYYNPKTFGGLIVANENDLNYYGTWTLTSMGNPPFRGYYMITKEGEPRTAFPAFWTGSAWRLFKQIDTVGNIDIKAVIAWTEYPKPLDS